MSKTILIVDDSFSMRQTLSNALKANGYEVVTASDGVDGVGKLDGRKFDMIISDLNMPNMDGISFVQAAKQMPAYKFTPVIMLTTQDDDATRALGKEAGVTALLAKPFQPPALLDMVAKLIK